MPSPATATTNDEPRRLVVATRLHLGHKSTPHTDDELEAKMTQFHAFCSECCESSLGVIAVDATPKHPDYSLEEAVQRACDKVQVQSTTTTTTPGARTHHSTNLHVLPVTPWGKFTPALNALISFAAVRQFDQIVFCSAETTATKADMDLLRQHMTPDTLVSGAVLAGHEYNNSKKKDEQQPIPLNGRTSPWNTLAIWDLPKLALTGFQLVSEGLHDDKGDQATAGVEEVVAIALLQKILGKDQAKSKLVALPGVQWQVDDWEGDEERQKWHEQKMNSKRTRADRQLRLLGLDQADGVVYHC